MVHGVHGAESEHADPRGRHTAGAWHALKADAPENIEFLSVTAAVFQPLMSALNVGAL
jgi:hypothetical protein